MLSLLLYRLLSHFGSYSGSGSCSCSYSGFRIPDSGFRIPAFPDAPLNTAVISEDMLNAFDKGLHLR